MKHHDQNDIDTSEEILTYPETFYNLKGKSIRELEELFKLIDEPPFRAKQAFRRVHRHLASSLDEFSEFPITLREKLSSLNALPSMNIITPNLSSDGTEKVIFDAKEGGNHAADRLIEAVWLVHAKRRTLCISSQAGCSLNCSFCATGALTFKGNLPAWMIVDQVYQFIRRRKEQPTNIVFMGMGEPFYNYENVIKAAKILNHPDGLHMSSKHITISTAGVITGIDRFTRDREPFNLAVSLNHTNSEGRLQIMDIEKKFPLDKLLLAVKRYTKESGERVTFEYVMIPGVNMEISDVRSLIKIARQVKCKVNLIPLNTSFHGWRTPREEEVQRFQDHLLEAGISVFNRGSSGKDINGACGMLALKGGAS